MAYPKGKPRPPGSGRKKGTVNKVTASIKSAFKEAFDELGGTDALVAWARTNQDDFYKLATKLIPTEIANPEGESFRTQATLTDDDRTLIQRHLALLQKSAK